MFAPIVRALTSRVAGPTATGVAAVLAVLLGLSWSSAAHTRAELEGRIARLNGQLNAATVYWQAPLAPGAARPALAEAPPAPGEASPEKIAERLVNEAPAGFDTCARMESADQAVLNSLK